MKDDLPKEAGELFTVPPIEFTKRRNDLAKELKKAGNLEALKRWPRWPSHPCRHIEGIGSILSRSGASGKPGTIQTLEI